MMFASDNWSGACPSVMAALTRHNDGYATAYGGDELTAAITREFCEIFERDVAVFFVATGTAANALALAHAARPGGAVLCHKGAHILVDECGAPEFHTQGKLIGLAGERGRISPAHLAAAFQHVPDNVVHHGRLDSLSLSQATEVGTLYRLDDITALSDLAKTRGLTVHMDGARFANALVALDVSPADMTWRAGIDCLSFGATKNGAYCAEAVVLFNPDKAAGFDYLRKRSGHLFSKSRFVAAQFEGYFSDNTWLANAAHANAMAQDLAATLTLHADCTLAWPCEANEVFVQLSHALHTHLQDHGVVYHPWATHMMEANEQPDAGTLIARFVTSYRTERDEIAALKAILASA